MKTIDAGANPLANDALPKADYPVHKQGHAGEPYRDQLYDLQRKMRVVELGYPRYSAQSEAAMAPLREEYNAVVAKHNAWIKTQR